MAKVHAVHSLTSVGLHSEDWYWYMRKNLCSGALSRASITNSGTNLTTPVFGQNRGLGWYLLQGQKTLFLPITWFVTGWDPVIFLPITWFVTGYGYQRSVLNMLSYFKREILNTNKHCTKKPGIYMAQLHGLLLAMDPAIFLPITWFVTGWDPVIFLPITWFVTGWDPVIFLPITWFVTGYGYQRCILNMLSYFKRAGGLNLREAAVTSKQKVK